MNTPGHKRLQYVVDRPPLEGGNGVFRIRGNKNHRWRWVLLFAQALDQLQTREPRHVNIEQQHIKCVVVERGQRLLCVVSHTELLDVGALREQGGQGSARQRLVIDNKDSHRSVSSLDAAPFSPGVLKAGIVMWAAAPCPFKTSNSKLASSPYRYRKRALVFAMPTPRPG